MGVASNHEVAALKEDLRKVTERLIRVELALQARALNALPTQGEPRSILKLKKDG